MPYPPPNARDRPESQADELEPNHTYYLLLEGDGKCADAEAEDLRMRRCLNYAEIMSKAGINLHDIAQKVGIFDTY